MPVYPLRFKAPSSYVAHPLPVVFNPVQLHFPDNVYSDEDRIRIPGGFTQSGFLKDNVTATFADGFQIIFPQNSVAIINSYTDSSQNHILLTIDSAGKPIMAQVGGVRRHRRRYTRSRHMKRKSPCTRRSRQ